ncbi:MAG: hypothetical protein HOW97_18875 [Catenulispora sp.]|nr:hypothetical protein [Catenulispora sp.]
MSTLRWAVVAADDDPGRAEWTQAAHAAGVPEPRFVSWRSVIAEEAEFQPAEHVIYGRLEGWAPSNPVGGQAERFREFTEAVERLDLAAVKAGAPLVAAASSTVLLLDRVGRDEHLREHGLPILDGPDPESNRLGIIRSRYTASDDWIIDGWHTQLFPHRARTGFEVWRNPADTSVGPSNLRQVLSLLEPHGVYARAELHRAYLCGRFHDLRFEVVDGKVTHAAGVLREEVRARPWYGGRRRELDNFVERFGSERWQRLVALAERTAALFPDIRSLGVDLIVDNREAEYVFDVDPFGADLPGLLGLPDTVGAGLSVRAGVLRALSAES